MRDDQRIELIRRSLQEHSLDALICTLPLNVLLLSGYWPVVGTSVAIASHDGRIILLVPEDESDLAGHSCATEIITFLPSSLDKMTTAAEAIGSPLNAVGRKLSRMIGRIGFESGEAMEPASYAGVHLYGGTIQSLLRNAFPSSTQAAADDLLGQLRAVKTHSEVARIRVACDLAQRAFRAGMLQLRNGITEVEAAAMFRKPLSTGRGALPGVERADGFVSCMSGTNSALACGAYARSRAKRIEASDLVLVHCNSYADGYWTDITRTYCLGTLSDRQRTMYAAVFAARSAAMRAIRPGVKAAEIDRLAREALGVRGFAKEFTHAAGHGVGFSAINSNAQPRLHPKSDDTIEAGMVFNLEPAIYIDDYGGMRHCDMVAATDNGAELLTPFQCAVDELVVDGS